VVARPKCRKTAGGGYRGSTTGEAQWPQAPGQRAGNRRPTLSDAAVQLVDIVGGWAQNGWQRPGLWHRVETQAGNAMEGCDR